MTSTLTICLPTISRLRNGLIILMWSRIAFSLDFPLSHFQPCWADACKSVVNPLHRLYAAVSVDANDEPVTANFNQEDQPPCCCNGDNETGEALKMTLGRDTS